MVMEPDADLPGYIVTKADRHLDSGYGDHAHVNDGTHLTGGVSDDGACLAGPVAGGY